MQITEIDSEWGRNQQDTNPVINCPCRQAKMGLQHSSNLLVILDREEYATHVGGLIEINLTNKESCLKILLVKTNENPI